MSLVKLVEYRDVSPDVRAVYDDIMATRGTDWIKSAVSGRPAVQAVVV